MRESRQDSINDPEINKIITFMLLLHSEECTYKENQE